jgi:hypothetical protein
MLIPERVNSLTKWHCFKSSIHAFLLPVVLWSCEIWYFYSDVERFPGCYGVPSDKYSVTFRTNWIFMLLSWSHWEQRNRDGRLPLKIFKKIWQLFVPLQRNATSVRSVDDKGQEITINWIWEAREICPPPIWPIQDRQLSDNCNCRSPQSRDSKLHIYCIQRTRDSLSDDERSSEPYKQYASFSQVAIIMSVTWRSLASKLSTSVTSSRLTVVFCCLLQGSSSTLFPPV